jgi:hypothetical protein
MQLGLFRMSAFEIMPPKYLRARQCVLHLTMVMQQIAMNLLPEI